jgi:hypothetical protein
VNPLALLCCPAIVSDVARTSLTKEVKNLLHWCNGSAGGWLIIHRTFLVISDTFPLMKLCI